MIKLFSQIDKIFSSDICKIIISLRYKVYEERNKQHERI